MEIVQLPQELLVLIIRFLDLRDILKVRQTCKLLCKVTYEREIWMNLLEEQMLYLPMPEDVVHSHNHTDTRLCEYSNSEIESVVTEAEIVSEMWSRDRPRPPYRLKREKVGSTVMGMKLFLDRWLLVVYFEGAAYLYDMQSKHEPSSMMLPERQSDTNDNITRTYVLRASLYLESGMWITHVAAIDQRGHSLYLALSRSAPPHMVQIYEVNLNSLSTHPSFIPNGFSLVKSIPLPLYKVIRAIEPQRRLIALSTAGVVDVINVDDCHGNPEDNPSTQTIRVNTDDQEGLWNGVIAVHFLDAYILVFRARSMEAHKYDPERQSTRRGHENRAMNHNFVMTFREVSFSQTKSTHHATTKTWIHEATFFAYDVLLGLFHYLVRVVSPESTQSAPPYIEVILQGVYPLAVGAHVSKLYIPLPPEMTPTNFANNSLTRNTSFSANFMPSPSPTPIASHVPIYASISSSARLQSQLDSGSRGFLSTHMIGGQGKRGIWVERKRTSTLREIQIWSKNSPSSTTIYEKSRTDSLVTAVEIPRRVVYTLQSFDLRDDITCCTFSELSGLIVLGHRSGDVSLLELSGSDP